MEQVIQMNQLDIPPKDLNTSNANAVGVRRQIS